MDSAEEEEERREQMDQAVLGVDLVQFGGGRAAGSDVAGAPGSPIFGLNMRGVGQSGRLRPI